MLFDLLASRDIRARSNKGFGAATTAGSVVPILARRSRPSGDTSLWLLQRKPIESHG